MMLDKELIALRCARVSEANPCSSVVKNFGGGAAGIRALPRGIATIAAVAARRGPRALPITVAVLAAGVVRAADIVLTITGDVGTAYRTTFAAKDVEGDTNLVMETVWEDGKAAASSRPPYQLTPGNYRFVWNEGADLPDGFESSRVTITVEAK